MVVLGVLGVEVLVVSELVVLVLEVLMVVLAETVVVVCFWVDDGIVGSFCSGVGRGCDDTSISGSGNVVMIAVSLVMGRDCGGGGAFFMI